MVEVPYPQSVEAPPQAAPAHKRSLLTPPTMHRRIASQSSDHVELNTCDTVEHEPLSKATNPGSPLAKVIDPDACIQTPPTRCSSKESTQCPSTPERCASVISSPDSVPPGVLVFCDDVHPEDAQRCHLLHQPASPWICSDDQRHSQQETLKCIRDLCSSPNVIQSKES